MLVVDGNLCVRTVRCDCGRVELSLMGEPLDTLHCHCDACRRFHGSFFSSIAEWRPAQLEVLSGEGELGEYHHPELNMTRYACPRCFVTMFVLNQAQRIQVPLSRIEKSRIEMPRTETSRVESDADEEAL